MIQLEKRTDTSLRWQQHLWEFIVLWHSSTDYIYNYWHHFRCWQGFGKIKWGKKSRFIRPYLIRNLTEYFCGDVLRGQNLGWRRKGSRGSYKGRWRGGSWSNDVYKEDTVCWIKLGFKCVSQNNDVFSNKCFILG